MVSDRRKGLLFLLLLLPTTLLLSFFFLRAAEARTIRAYAASEIRVSGDIRDDSGRNAAHVERRTLKGGGRGRAGRGRARGHAKAHSEATTSHGSFATALSATLFMGSILVPV